MDCDHSGLKWAKQGLDFVLRNGQKLNILFNRSFFPGTDGGEVNFIFYTVNVSELLKIIAEKKETKILLHELTTYRSNQNKVICSLVCFPTCPKMPCLNEATVQKLALGVELIRRSRCTLKSPWPWKRG